MTSASAYRFCGGRRSRVGIPQKGPTIASGLSYTGCDIYGEDVWDISF